MLPLQQLDACRWSLLLLLPFCASLLLVTARHPVMFVRRHGRSHRLLGLAHLVLLALGLTDAVWYSESLVRDAVRLLYDLALSACGTALALSAAHAFQHKRVNNRASGALDEDATVTHAEMVEHAFYQALNGVQATHLHATQLAGSRAAKVALCLLATSPWLVRHRFPVNSFSQNYATAPWSRTALMYRLKKYQYVLYKHALLHGLNVSMALAQPLLAGERPLVQSRAFRLYWVCLNAAYVLEFFLQTLVKRAYLRQSRMLGLNALLMAASTSAALPVLLQVRAHAALLSLALNFARRGRDVSTTAIVLAAVAARSR